MSCNALIIFPHLKSLLECWKYALVYDLCMAVTKDFLAAHALTVPHHLPCGCYNADRACHPVFCSWQWQASTGTVTSETCL